MEQTRNVEAFKGEGVVAIVLATGMIMFLCWLVSSIL